jgi:dihydrofolate synthase/folylpolyglutamate synthase
MSKSLRSYEYLLSRIPLGFSKGLCNIKVLCHALGEPQKGFESIHIAGTNGKGSTALYLADVLQAHGISTGLFTSPHLVSVRERFRINGKMISQGELDSLLSQIENVAKIANVEPSYFETLTAAAFLWFKENRVQVAVLEAGLGGRLDSTKIATGNIAAITSISLDHTELLGNTEEKILKEKLGILKKNATLVLGNLPKQLSAKCPHHVKTKKITPELQVKNFGKIYIKNAELAWAIAKEFLNSQPKFNATLARNALKKAIWPGRMQMLYKNKKLGFILDGAHNPAAAKILAKCLKEKNIPPLPCIFASLTDKDTKGVLKALKPHISACCPVQIENPRARGVAELLEICRELKIKTVSKVHHPVLITGSLYLVGKAVSELADEYSELAEFRGLEKIPNEGKFSTLPSCRLKNSTTNCVPCRTEQCFASTQWKTAKG